MTGKPDAQVICDGALNTVAILRRSPMAASAEVVNAEYERLSWSIVDQQMGLLQSERSKAVLGQCASAITTTVLSDDLSARALRVYCCSEPVPFQTVATFNASLCIRTSHALSHPMPRGHRKPVVKLFRRDVPPPATCSQTDIAIFEQSLSKQDVIDLNQRFPELAVIHNISQNEIQDLTMCFGHCWGEEDAFSCEDYFCCGEYLVLIKPLSYQFCSLLVNVSNLPDDDVIQLQRSCKLIWLVNIERRLCTENELCLYPCTRLNNLLSFNPSVRIDLSIPLERTFVQSSSICKEIKLVFSTRTPVGLSTNSSTSRNNADAVSGAETSSSELQMHNALPLSQAIDSHACPNLQPTPLCYPVMGSGTMIDLALFSTDPCYHQNVSFQTLVYCHDSLVVAPPRMTPFYQQAGRIDFHEVIGPNSDHPLSSLLTSPSLLNDLCALCKRPLISFNNGDDRLCPHTVLLVHGWCHLIVNFIATPNAESTQSERIEAWLYCSSCLEFGPAADLGPVDQKPLTFGKVQELLYHCNAFASILGKWDACRCAEASSFSEENVVLYCTGLGTGTVVSIRRRPNVFCSLQLPSIKHSVSVSGCDDQHCVQQVVALFEKTILHVVHCLRNEQPVALLELCGSEAGLEKIQLMKLLLNYLDDIHVSPGQVQDLIAGDDIDGVRRLTKQLCVNFNRIILRLQELASKGGGLPNWVGQSPNSSGFLDVPYQHLHFAFPGQDCLKQISTGCPVVVRDDEPSSLIAYALRIQECKQIADCRDCICDEQGHVEFGDKSSRYFCKMFNGRGFRALREKAGVNEDAYIHSLRRCRRWNPKGGKSGTSFYITADNSYCIKQLSRVESE